MKHRLIFAISVSLLFGIGTSFGQSPGALLWKYATDGAIRGAQVEEAFRPGEESYQMVVYPAAVVQGSRQAALAQAFVDRLGAPEGQAVLRRFGFRPPPPGPR